MKDIITVETLSPEGSYGLLMDDAALDASARTVFSGEERRRFETVYSIVPTDSSTDADAQYAVHKKYWEEAGVSFGGTDISLISVCLHNHFSEESNELLIGHTGVLLRDGEDYLFFEKLSFQLPYQLIRFADKAELRAYLMAAYDVDYTGESARPFILENGALLGSGEQL